MSRKVIVTGGSGFIGRHACAQLAKRGFEVHALSLSGVAAENVFVHKCDLFDAERRRALIEEIQPTDLLHLAWYAEHGKFWHSTENYKWVEASIALVMEFQASGGRRVVSAGTCAEYDWNFGFCSERVTPTKPNTPYGVCKNSLRRTLESFSSEVGLSSAWGRIFFLYGPAEAQGRLVPSVITSLLRDVPAECSHGEQVRDFLHVSDVAAAFVALLESDVQGPVNIASGEPVRLKTIIEAIGDLLGKRGLIRLGAIPAREGDPPFIVADTQRLNHEVCWRPSISIEDGLRDAIGWWKANLS